VLFERLRSPIIGLERANFTMPSDVHDAEDVSAVVQGRRHKAGPKL